MGDIENRSRDLSNIAFNLKNNADQLRKEAKRRNLRLMIITGLVGVAVLAFIIQSFAGSGDTSDDEN